MSTLQSGDMVNINYTGRTKEDNKVFDTTFEDVAKKEDIFDEKVIYRPFTLIIGKNWLPEGLEEEIIGMKEGEKKTIEFEAKKGFGLRDRSKIRLVQRREFQRHQIKPKEDMKVEIGGQEGRILKVSSSRVKVDFNHDLAGYDLSYYVEIEKKITDIKEQFICLLEKRLPGVDFSSTKIDLKDKSIVVELPNNTRFMEYIQFIRNGVTRDLSEITTKYDNVTFIEHYKIEKKK
ncbi:MAG: FKBP-type peptidyl-prolyl cis-trans isomerase [Candidatus Heimdallarchaeota archaeon]|nr:FKBP-type peptidyl-prolyl cis-trans isomerase [Candidatus Heimdallarchaeota archaeon]MCK4953809.1 FKBP-type peptidyl-prolyl cis-trans isomerase [Candidatus Heimdallarchaeota archaeon]